MENYWHNKKQEREPNLRWLKNPLRSEAIRKSFHERISRRLPIAQVKRFRRARQAVRYFLRGVIFDVLWAIRADAHVLLNPRACEIRRSDLYGLATQCLGD